MQGFVPGEGGLVIGGNDDSTGRGQGRALISQGLSGRGTYFGEKGKGV